MRLCRYRVGCCMIRVARGRRKFKLSAERTGDLNRLNDSADALARIHTPVCGDVSGNQAGRLIVVAGSAGSCPGELSSCGRLVRCGTAVGG